MAQTDSLTHYTGKYTFPEGSPVTEITVVLESGVLTATSAMGNTELRKTQTDVFDIVAFGGTATFKRNAEGKVTGVQIIVGDVNMEGTKSDKAAIFIQPFINQSFAVAFVEGKACYIN
ncbi:hypothetical protein CAP36_16085 [Chitinophagaceae bacterium IBVUCB2]|nr:hypothetical protein CAP36_16085 [Chitinophagaceae bacterium IBVUCB2]